MRNRRRPTRGKVTWSSMLPEGRLTLRGPLRQFLLVFRRLLAGNIFFFFDLSGLRFQFGFRGLDFLFARLRVDHQLENLVFIRPNFLLGELDFVQQRFVLLVRLHIKRLVAIFRNFSSQVVDRALILSLVGVVGFDRRTGLFELSLGSSQFFFDYGYALGKFGDFRLQPLDFAVGALE